MRKKIIDTLRDSVPLTAKQIADRISESSDAVSKFLNYLVRIDIVNEHHEKINRKKAYILNAKKTLPRGTVKAYIKANPGSTVAEIAEGIPCATGTVNEYIRNALREGSLHREHNEKNVYKYTMREDITINFGRGGPMRAMYEDLLRSVRNNKQISCK